MREVLIDWDFQKHLKHCFVCYEINVSVFEDMMLWFSQFGGEDEKR